MVILLDTDICIELLRGNKTALERSRRCTEIGAVAAMTVAELFYGAQKSENPRNNSEAVEQFILTVPVIHTDLSICRRFGTLKSTLEKKGTPLPDADVLIAATALSADGSLVTGNTDHFRLFPKLRLENWIRSE